MSNGEPKPPRSHSGRKSFRFKVGQIRPHLSRWVERRPRKDGKRWTASDIGALRRMARNKLSVRAIANALGRTPSAVRRKAASAAIVLVAVESATSPRRHKATRR